jgi:hypothetical protein
VLVFDQVHIEMVLVKISHERVIICFSLGSDSQRVLLVLNLCSDEELYRYLVLCHQLSSVLLLVKEVCYGVYFHLVNIVQLLGHTNTRFVHAVFHYLKASIGHNLMLFCPTRACTQRYSYNTSHWSLYCLVLHQV